MAFPITVEEATEHIGPFPMGSLWPRLTNIRKLEYLTLVNGLWKAIPWKISPFDETEITDPISSALLAIFASHVRYLISIEGTPDETFPESIKTQLEPWIRKGVLSRNFPSLRPGRVISGTPISGNPVDQGAVERIINSVVAAWARQGNNDRIPSTKLTMPATASEAEGGTSTAIRSWTANLIRLAINAVVPAWARKGNNDTIPDAKLPASASSPSFAQGEPFYVFPSTSRTVTAIPAGYSADWPVVRPVTADDTVSEDSYAVVAQETGLAPVVDVQFDGASQWLIDADAPWTKGAATFTQGGKTYEYWVSGVEFYPNNFNAIWTITRDAVVVPEIVSDAEATAGTSTTIRSWTAAKIKMLVGTSSSGTPAELPDEVTRVAAEAGTSNTIRSWTAAKVRIAVNAVVSTWARSSSSAKIPNAKLPDVVSASDAAAGTSTAIRSWTAVRVRAAINAIVPTWARTGNADTIPADKIPGSSGSGSGRDFISATPVKSGTNWVADEIEYDFIDWLGERHTLLSATLVKPVVDNKQLLEFVFRPRDRDITDDDVWYSDSNDTGFARDIRGRNGPLNRYFVFQQYPHYPVVIDTHHIKKPAGSRLEEWGERTGLGGRDYRLTFEFDVSTDSPYRLAFPTSSFLNATFNIGIQELDPPSAEWARWYSTEEISADRLAIPDWAKKNNTDKIPADKLSTVTVETASTLLSNITLTVAQLWTSTGITSEDIYDGVHKFPHTLVFGTRSQNLITFDISELDTGNFPGQVNGSSTVTGNVLQRQDSVNGVVYQFSFQTQADAGGVGKPRALLIRRTTGSGGSRNWSFKLFRDLADV